MPKFYVETGSLQEILEASGPFEACVNAVHRASNHYLKTGDGDVTLGEWFVVNEKGFPSDREPFLLDTTNDSLFPTKEIIEAYDESQ